MADAQATGASLTAAAVIILAASGKHTLRRVAWWTVGLGFLVVVALLRG